MSEPLLTQKQRCRIRDFQTVDGVMLPDFDLGYETWGTLAPERDNVILVCHYFSGNSHAAGYYHEDDTFAGWWDSIIGAGKAIDTKRFFVICIDTLVNQNLNAIGCSPATLNPETGRPYGAEFPSLTMRDFVNAQKKLLSTLGIETLYAVAGPSMGSMQALTWAAAYPDAVGRVLAVIPAGLSADPYLIERTEQWGLPIRLDPNWNNGQYYDREQRPEIGLQSTIRQIMLDALHPDFLTPLYGRQRRENGAWVVHHAFQKQARLTAEQSDPNAILALITANQRYDLIDDPKQGDARSIIAPLYFIVSETDLLLYPERAAAAANWLKTQGKTVYLSALTGSGGHLEGVTGIAELADEIRTFLD